jgi:hypothetical protein
MSDGHFFFVNQRYIEEEEEEAALSIASFSSGLENVLVDVGPIKARRMRSSTTRNTRKREREREREREIHKFLA